MADIERDQCIMNLWWLMEMHESISFALLARSMHRPATSCQRQIYTWFACVKGKKNRLTCRSIGPRTQSASFLLIVLNRMEREHARNAFLYKKLNSENVIIEKKMGREKEAELKTGQYDIAWITCILNTWETSLLLQKYTGCF